MKLFTVMLCLFLISLLPQYLTAQNNNDYKKKLIRENMLGNNSLGSDFIIAVPPNDVDASGDGNGILEAYVSCAKPTKINIDINGVYAGSEKMLKPFGVVVLGQKYLKYALNEIRNPEIPHKNSIRIYSEDLISVYVINSKSASTDGYMAIPISKWGTAYTHCAYYENNEGTNSGGNFYKTGFIAVAAYDSTELTITLKGVGGDFAKTSTGRSIGDQWKTTINRHEVYQVSGDGSNRGEFDLTGSLVTSTKPIGFFSYDERTPLPIFTNSSRDHLVEMIMPNSSLGTKYYSQEYKRNLKKGDFYRIVTTENITRCKVCWYDKKTKVLRGSIDTTLLRAGDFLELPKTKSMYSPNEDYPGIGGLVSIEADKPILAMQYATSALWGGSPGDAFMIMLTPAEHFTNNTIFQAPENYSFTNNFFVITAIGDSADPVRNLSLLSSLKLDNKNLVYNDTNFISNRIPGTNVYTTELFISGGPHYVSGDTKFGGYVYGIMSVDSYGWPAAIGLNKIDEKDSLIPAISVTKELSSYLINVKELENNGTEQIDQGISDKPIIIYNENFDLAFDYYTETGGKFTSFPVKYDYNFRIKVLNKTLDGKLMFAVQDRAGNVAIDSILFYSAKLKFDPSTIVCGEVECKKDTTVSVTISNNNIEDIIVNQLYMKKNHQFSITNDSINLPYTLLPNEQISVDIKYTPGDMMNDYKLHTDSLLVITDNNYFACLIKGNSIPSSVLDASALGYSVVCSPNPIRNSANISVKSPEGKTSDMNIVLTDARGIEVMKIASDNYFSGEKQINIDLSALPSGTYFISASFSGAKLTLPVTFLK